MMLSLCWGGLCLQTVVSEIKRRQEPNNVLTFLVVGDWGRGGTFNQSMVASQVNWELNRFLFKGFHFLPMDPPCTLKQRNYHQFLSILKQWTYLQRSVGYRIYDFVICFHWHACSLYVEFHNILLFWVCKERMPMAFESWLYVTLVVFGYAQWDSVMSWGILSSINV